MINSSSLLCQTERRGKNKIAPRRNNDLLTGNRRVPVHHTSHGRHQLVRRRALLQIVRGRTKYARVRTWVRNVALLGFRYFYCCASNFIGFRSKANHYRHGGLLHSVGFRRLDTFVWYNTNNGRVVRRRRHTAKRHHELHRVGNARRVTTSLTDARTLLKANSVPLFRRERMKRLRALYRLLNRRLNQVGTPSPRLLSIRECNHRAIGTGTTMFTTGRLHCLHNGTSCLEIVTLIFRPSSANIRRPFRVRKKGAPDRVPTATVTGTRLLATPATITRQQRRGKYHVTTCTT